MAGVLREGAYSGGSQMGADWSQADRGRPAAPEPDEDDGATPAPDEDDGAAPDEDDEHQDDGAGGDPPARSSGAGFASEGAGWVLGVLLWGWVVLPFVKGGPAGVGRTLMAKFFNRAPDGSELP